MKMIRFLNIFVLAVVIKCIQSAIQTKRDLNQYHQHFPTRHTFSEIHHRVPIPYPQPVPFTVPRPVPYTIPVGVPVDQPRPVPVAVPHPVAHLIPRPVAVPIDRPFAYPIAHPVPVTITQGVGIPVPQPYAVGFPAAVPVRVPQPVPVYVGSTAVHQPVVATQSVESSVSSEYSDGVVESHGHEIQHPY